MAVTYTNRKGKEYILCAGQTKTGKPRYFFAREQKGEVLESIPDGYEISESVNGIVSLSKFMPKLITDEELSIIEQAINAHPKRHTFRVKRRGNRIDIYEGVGMEMGDLANLLIKEFGYINPGARQSLLDLDERHRQFTAVMRFTLLSKVERLFDAERMCYRGSVEDWLLIGTWETLAYCAANFIPALGTDRFYELY